MSFAMIERSYFQYSHDAGLTELFKDFLSSYNHTRSFLLYCSFTTDTWFRLSTGEATTKGVIVYINLFHFDLYILDLYAILGTRFNFEFSVCSEVNDTYARLYRTM